MPFNRGLGPNSIKKLEAEAAKGPGSWWADALADPDLFIGIRRKSLGIYYRGQRLFHVTFLRSDLRVTTHAKYLVDPKLADLVELRDKTFEVERVREIGFVHNYDGKETLSKMKSAAAIYSGLEKTGSHEIAVRNSEVIDWEIAFSSGSQAPRVDLAVLEEEGHQARLVFWEAKDYSNSDFRAASGRTPAVCEQIKIYETLISKHRQEIEDSYKKVVANLVAINGMRTAARTLSRLVVDVAKGKPLTLGENPRVGLIIFGFGAAVQIYPRFRKQLDLLGQHISVIKAFGHPVNVRFNRRDPELTSDTLSTLD